MKKTTLILLLIFCLSASGCARTETNTPAGMKLASVDAVDYYMYVPNEWIIADQDGVTAAYASLTDKSNVTCVSTAVTNEAVFDIPADREEGEADGLTYAKNYWIGYASQLQSHLPGYTLISGPNSALLDGQPAVRCRYSAKVNDKDYTFDMVICIRERMFSYLITYTAESAVFENNLASYEKIISEFVFQTGVLE